MFFHSKVLSYCLTFCHYNVIHQYFEACYLKSPGNMGMPLRTIIPTFLILKSFSVIPHQEWDKIQVLLREERKEGEGHEEGQKWHKMIQTQT